MNHLVPRDEREQGIDRAADRLAYLVLSFGLLAIVAYRSVVDGAASWDLLGLTWGPRGHALPAGRAGRLARVDHRGGRDGGRRARCGRRSPDSPVRRSASPRSGEGIPTKPIEESDRMGRFVHRISEALRRARAPIAILAVVSVCSLASLQAGDIRQQLRAQPT